jgi:hypothetical protein
MAEEIQREQRSSITLKRSVNGKYGWDVKVYFDPAIPEFDHSDALDLMAEIDRELRSGYLEEK